MNNDRSEITIILVSYYSKDIIEKPLNSIDPGIRIIVIENSNSGECKNYLEKKYKNVQVILSEQNLGNGGGINLGLKNVKTKYAFYLDADTELQANTINELLTAAKQIEEFTILAPIVKKYDYKKEDYLIFDQIAGKKFIPMKFVPGCALFFNIAELSKIGFYDENFFLFYEEYDIFMRCIKNSHNIYMIKDALITHTGKTSVDEKYHEEVELIRNWHYMWSKFYFYKKHYNSIFGYIKTLNHFFSAVCKLCFYKFIDPKKYLKYRYRASGLINSYLGKKSWKRPSIN